METSLLGKIYSAEHPTLDITLNEDVHPPQAGVLWLSLINPTANELDRILSQLLSSNTRALEEMKIRHRRPKVVEYNEASLIVAILPSKSQQHMLGGEVQLLFGSNFLLTLWRNTTINDRDFCAQLEQHPTQILRGADYVVADLLNEITDFYTDQLQVYERRVEHVEKSFFGVERFQQHDITQAFKLRRELLRLQNSIAPLSELARRFARQPMPYISPTSQAYFAEVADRIARLSELIGVYRDTVAFAFEGGAMIIDLQQTDISRKLAAWAAILAIPTALAGIYGMNFKIMPELDWTFGYPLVLLVMLSICLSLYVKFKKMKWL